MAIYVAYLIILSLLAGIIVDIPSALATALCYAIGTSLVYCSNSKEKLPLVKIYSVAFLTCLTYTLACYLYMVSHGYDHLLIADTGGYYMPKMEEAIGGAQSLEEAIVGIWKDYDVLLRSNAGYMTYMAFCGYLASQIGADLYFSIQLATLAICSFGAVIVYKLLSYYIEDKNYVFRFAVIISILPMFWQYSTLILRDGLIALGFYYIIWLLHRVPSALTILKFALIIGVLITLRTETGFASVMFVPMFLLMKKGERKKSMMIYCALTLGIVILGYFIYQNSKSIIEVYSRNQEAYFSDTGTGTIGFLGKIPLLGNVISLIYGLLQPIPCWLRLSLDMATLKRPNCYNIMGFPSISYVAFNTYIICYFINFLFYYTYKTIEARKLKIIMIPSAIFMLLQSGIVEPRRMMGVFVVFYVFWAIIYRQVSPTYNKLTYSLFVKVFLVLQIIGIVRYL